jgi:hypothetical protein
MVVGPVLSYSWMAVEVDYLISDQDLEGTGWSIVGRMAPDPRFRMTKLASGNEVELVVSCLEVPNLNDVVE